MHVPVTDGMKVMDRVMHRTTIVPKQEIVQLPAVTVNEFGFSRMCEEELQDRIALGPGELHDMGRETRIYEERFPSGFRMCTNHGMLYRRAVSYTHLTLPTKA